MGIVLSIVGNQLNIYYYVIRLIMILLLDHNQPFKYILIAMKSSQYRLKDKVFTYLLVSSIV
jgi:hypothetical protein